MASEDVIGKLSVRVVRGQNLVIADSLTKTSDTYVVLSYGSQVDPSPSQHFFPFSSHCCDGSSSIFDTRFDGEAIYCHALVNTVISVGAHEMFDRITCLGEAYL
jgi:hypothetical protein